MSPPCLKQERREVEADRDEDGEPEFRYLRIYSEGKVVYFESTDHRLKIGMRAYHIADDPKVYEMDVGLDGHFEWVLIGKPDPDESIVLHRDAGGAIRKASDEEMRKIRPMQRVVNGFEKIRFTSSAGNCYLVRLPHVLTPLFTLVTSPPYFY